jgi:ribosomal protein L23
VDVARVNIVNAPAKRGRRAKSRRLLVRRPSFKKAIVTLAEGSKPLEIFEGVQ